ncbi:glycoside hydrolase family 26 protein [Streptomyces albus subsp. chlorinus]|uniref:glycoside hydrolase family 26 protein n=2 Tax=Streptomyces albus TaxID=1888 RepID=UPI003D0E4D07
MRTPSAERTRGHGRIRAALCGGAVTAGLLASCTVLPGGEPEPGRAARPGERPPPAPPAPPSAPAVPGAAAGRVAGAFLGSGPDGVRRMHGMEEWLGGDTTLRVGHTYLPGRLWADIEGRPEFLEPWARWRRAQAARLFVLNVPMLARSEAGLPDAEVRALLRRGAGGGFDGHFRTLAARLVERRLADTVLVLGWEMNGTTYTHRCAPDPGAWRRYWRRIVTVMRSVPGQRFRFDFAPSRGRDAIGWTRCYPGDDVVDVLGMDAYDQPEGMPFAEQVREPYGLQAQVDFAARHGKPVSYPEWGLFRNGDNADYMRRMLAWMARHRPLYQTISDYCPHGVWQCRDNPRSAAAYRATLHDQPPPAPPWPKQPPKATPPQATPPPGPPPPHRPPEESRPPVPPRPPRPTDRPAPPRPWWERCWEAGRHCVRLDWLRTLLT